MASKTVNYQLTKPDETDFYDIAVQNENMDRIDSAIKNIAAAGIAYAGTATNIGNTYSIEEPAISALVEGMAVSFKCSANSSGATSLNWSQKGNKAILKSNGLAVSNLKAGSIYTVRYNGTSFILQGEGGEYGTATPTEVLNGYTIGSENGVVNGTLTLTGDANASNVLSGKTFYNTNVKSKITGTIPSKATQTYTPSTVDQTIAANQFLSGVQTIKGDPNLVSSKIKTGESIFGITGSFAGNTASGILTSSSSTSYFTRTDGTVLSAFPVGVSGLSFTPNVILLYKSASDLRLPVVYKSGGVGSDYKGNIGVCSFGSNESLFKFNPPLSVFNGGFVLPWYYPNDSMYWIAF